MLDLYNSMEVVGFHRSVLNKKIDQTIFNQLINYTENTLSMSDLVYQLDRSGANNVLLCELLAPYFLNRYKDAGIPYLASDFDHLITELDDSIVKMFGSRDAIRLDIDKNYDRCKCRLLSNAYDMSNVNDIFICSSRDLSYVYSEDPTVEDIAVLVDCMLDVFSFILGEMVSGDGPVWDVSNLCLHNEVYGIDLYFWDVLTSVTYAYGNYSEYYHKVLLNVISLFKASEVASKPIDVVSLLVREGFYREYAENGANVYNRMNITYNDVFDSFNL